MHCSVCVPTYNILYIVLFFLLKKETCTLNSILILLISNLYNNSGIIKKNFSRFCAFFNTHLKIKVYLLFYFENFCKIIRCIVNISMIFFHGQRKKNINCSYLLHIFIKKAWQKCFHSVRGEHREN